MNQDDKMERLFELEDMPCGCGHQCPHDKEYEQLRKEIEDDKAHEASRD